MPPSLLPGAGRRKRPQHRPAYSFGALRSL